MNKIYRVIWNKQLACWQAVSELAKSHSSTTQKAATSETESFVFHSLSSVSSWMRSILFFSVAVLPLSIHAAISSTELPTGAQINSGSASFNQTGNTLNINQNSQNLSTHWNTFNIGQDATVNFNQPNQSATAINHVLDSNASQIMGRLNANGQVFLLNPNGVVFSKTAQVNVGGLVASTLNLNDADIQNGKFTLKGDANSTASIENQGSIQTLQGGTVALIAPNVKNTGTISTPNGTTHLTSASQVTLALQDGSLTQYQVDQGVLQGLVENGGAIIADNGAVYLTAKAKDSLSKAVVNHSGIIEANRLIQNAKGEIILLGDMQTGETHVSGTLKAEGKNGQDGGFIETSAAHVEIAADTKVSMASDTGKSGLWLIDPVDITIDTAKATAIQTALNSGDVTVTTANSASNSWGVNGTGTAKGDIHVNSAISWSSNQALTLRADNDININADITATGATGKLNLKYGQTISNTNANYYLNNGAKVNLKAGDNFSTQKGAEAVKEYKVITGLGVAGSMTKTDLQGINGNLSGNYVLGADIDAITTSTWNGGAGFKQVGSDSTYFTGTLDGLGHMINNLTINRPTEWGVGLIGAGNNITIQNLGLVDANVSGAHSSGILAGFLTGSSTLNNVYTTGNIVGGAAGYTGGIVGCFGDYTTTPSKAFVTNSFSSANVINQKSGHRVGGLIGGVDNNLSEEITIKNSYFSGSLNSNGDSVGGLVGGNYYLPTINIENSYVVGSVIGNTNVGALLGAEGNPSLSIKNSFWNTETTGQTQAVSNNSGTLTNVTGLTTAQMFEQSNLTGFDFGKVWGNANNQTTPYLLNLANNQVFNKNDLPIGTINTTNRPALYTAILNVNQLQDMNKKLSGKYLLGNNIDASDTVNWNSGAGFNPIGNGSTAFTGIFDGLNHTINDLTINRPTQIYIGLLGFSAAGSKIRNIGIVNGQVTGLAAVGGLVGNNLGDINNSFNLNTAIESKGFASFYTGVSTCSNSCSSVGGLVGWNSGSLSNTFSTGQVKGSNNFVGGLVGVNHLGTISNVYSTGAVSGTIYVGGLVGDNELRGSISNAYATGIVTGTNNVGGLVGINEATINNSFWNTETTGQSTSAGGTGLTTAQMQDLSTFTTTGWDIDAVGGTGKIWRIYEGQTAPLLRSFLTQATINATDKTVTYNGQTQGLDTANLTGLDNSKIFSSKSNSKNVGTYALQYYSNQQGYDLIGNSATLTISPKDITVTANGGSSTYGDNPLNPNFSATGLVNGETESVLTGLSNSFGITNTTNAGSHTLTVVGTLTNSNYNITQRKDGTWVVDKAKATVTANSKSTIYNGQNQTVSGFTASGLVNGEDESVLEDVSASVGARNAGTYINKATGTDDNYELIFVDGSLDIAKAQIDQVTGITANNKIYDGTTVAILNTGSAGFTGMVAGDDLTVANSTANFSDKNVGVGKTVNITGLRLGGADAQNYTLVDTTALTTADIQPMISASYLQAIQFKRPRYLPETSNALNTVNIELRQGGVNTSGIQTLAGEH